jgi:hypothetical protein
MNNNLENITIELRNLNHCCNFKRVKLIENKRPLLNDDGV